MAELASMRFLRERIRLTQRAKGDAKKETESTARDITAALTADEASDILEKIRVNTQRVFTATKDRRQRKFLKLVEEKQASVSKAPHVDQTPRKLTEKLLSLKRSGHLSETVYNKIKPRHKQPPRIYGQPKIHKQDLLYRV